MKTLLRKAPSLNTYEGMYDRLSSKAPFNHEEWSFAANDGTLDMYAAGIEKFDSLGIDYEKYKRDLKLDYADARTRITALYNEVYSDKENEKERSRTVYDENGVARVEKYLASDYEYTRELIKNQTDYAEQVERNRVADEMKDSASVWSHVGSSLVGLVTGTLQGVMHGIENIQALTNTAVNYVLSMGKIDPAKHMAESYGAVFGNLPDYIADFESKYTTIRYSDGRYTDLGRYIGGTSTSLGEMLPSMLIGKGVSKAFSAAGYTANSAVALGSRVSQASFYGGMFAGNVKDTYLEFQRMGADVDSSSILANAAIKSALQWGVEKGLGKILGSTSLDEVVFGRAQRSLSAKPTALSAVGRILKDAGQEGLEEVLQDTSDFLVNEAFSNYIDAYGVNNEISFQSLFDAFVIGAITSVAGSAKQVLQTKKYITDSGLKLNKLASWEYGINMESFYKNIGEIMDNASKVNYDYKNTDRNVIEGAALEAYASYRVITSIYQEIGDERFKAANQVLDKITEQIKSGTYQYSDISSYTSKMKEQLKHLSNLSLEKMVSELKKKNVKEVKRTIKADDKKATEKGTETEEKLTPKEARDKLEELFEESGAETVTETDGNVEVEKDGNIVISSDRLNNESINEILQNLSVQKLVSHLSELSSKERVRDNLSKTYEEYYGKTASEDADVISLLFDADFFKAVLMKSNKDVFKYLSYFAEAEKNLVRGKRRDEIYRNKINEIRNHWFNHLADYCIIHEEANPTMFLNYISDVKKRKEIENKVKKGRWGTDIYNRVLLSESNLDKLSENEKVVLRTRFDNAFAKSIATRHWNNVNSNNAKARQQSMNALSNKYQGLFSSKYDGVTYMPDISIGNRVFNKFMQSLGLDLSTLLNKNYLTESDVKLITDDYGKVDENSILNFRKAQFKEMSTVYDFTINKSGHFEVTHKGKIVGFSKYRKLQKDIEEGKKADTSVTDTKVKSDRLSKLINTDLITTSASYYTIDDVITNPELLKPEVANEIVKFANDKYGLKLTRPTADTTFLYLRNYFLSEFKDMTIVMSNDGEFVFASVKKIVDLFKNPNIKITKDTKLSDIIKDKYLPEGLNLKIVEGRGGAKYVPYKNIEKDGATITVLDNTIYIGDKVFEDDDDYIRFVFAHEFQHALQFINNINAGVDYTWIDSCDKKQRKEIIADIRKHKPELFKGVKEGSEIESRIANDFVYHSTGESDAYGLQGNEVLDFVPVLSKNDKNVLTFVMPWGTVHKIKNVKKADVISSIWKKEADNLWRFTDLKDLYSLNVNDDIYIREEVKLKEYGELMPQLDKLEYQTEYGYYLNRWLSRPLNTDGFISEDWKKIIKENLTSEQKTDSIKRLHRVIAPNVPFDEFINTDINFVRLQSRGFLADSPFVSIYANPSIDNAHKLLEYACTKSRQHKVSVNSYIIAGAFKPKDLLFYFPTQNNEVLIEPSKLIGSKFYKMNNDIVIVDSNGKEVDSFTESWRFVAISNHSNRILFEPSLDEENGNTYLVGADVSENKTVKIPIKKGEYTLRYFGDDLTLDEIIKLSKNKEKSFYEEFPIATTKYGSISFDNTKRSAFYIDNFDTLERIESNSLEDRASVNVRITDPNGRVITPEETETSLAELESLYGMSLKPKTSLADLNGATYKGKDFWLAVVDLKGNIVKTWTYAEAEERGFDVELDAIFDNELKDGYRFFSTDLIEENGRIEYDDHGNKMPNSMIERINQQIKIKDTLSENILTKADVEKSFEAVWDQIVTATNGKYKDVKDFLTNETDYDSIDYWHGMFDVVGDVPLNRVDGLWYNGDANWTEKFSLGDIVKAYQDDSLNNIKKRYDDSVLKITDFEELFDTSQYSMSLKPKSKKKYLKEGDIRAKDFRATPARQTAGYTERYYVLNEDGTQKLDKRGKPVYKYVYPKKESRYVSKNKYAGTNLQYFVKSYSPTTMSPELQKFILNAKDLDPVLQNKINGKEKGTLTQRYVFDYLRSKTEIDDNTFKQINDAFFKNEYIKTFNELQYRIDHSMRESWALYRLFKLHPKLQRNKHLLDDVNESFESIFPLIERNKEYLEMYAKLLLEYDDYNGKAFNVSDSYARMRYMRHYDGTVNSERDVSSVVRLIAMLEAKDNWNITKASNDAEFTEAYEEAIESLDLSHDEMVEAIWAREIAIAAKSDRDYFELKNELLELKEKLTEMSAAEIQKLYNKKEGSVSRIVLEGLIADADGNYLYISPDTPKMTSSHLVNRMKGRINSLKRILTPKEVAKIVEENSDIFGKGMSVNNELYQNKIRNKTRDGYHYENKSVEEVQEVFDKVAEICDRVREEKRIGKANVDARDKQIKELQRKIKQLERDKKNQKAEKIPKVHEIIVEGETLQIETNKEIPLSLLKILQVHYNKTAKSSVQNLSSDNKRHIKMVSETFLEENAYNFNNLTQADVDEIIDFYLTTDVAFNNATTPYQLAEIWTLTYLVKQGRNGNPNFVIDNDKLRKIEHLLESIIKRSATNLSTWRSALKELNPEAVIANAMARKIGIEVSEDDVERIIDAIDTKDMEKVEKVKGDIYKKLLKERKQSKQSKTDFLDKLLQYERLAMLSGPGTWVRNQASNAVITGVNKLSDGMSGKLEKVLNKLFPKSQYIESQYKIAGTKVTDEVSNYILNNLVNNGLLDIVIDSLSKYDVRKPTTGRDSSAVLADMIAGSIKQQFQREPLFANEKARKVEKFLLKMISDDKSVKKAALGYLGKMITEDLETGRIKAKVEVLSENRISKHFMTYVAEAFKLASYDYMHKPNFFFNLESQIAKKSKGAYFMYKQVFPFVGASWNWFVEGLKYSPVGLAKAIVNYAKLENTIDKYERKRQTFEYGDVGVSSDFAKYLTIRDINKGIIGSVGTLIGVLLVAFGVAKIDEDDDKYKLFVGDARIDISDIFGTQGIFLGIAVTSNIISEDADIVDTFSAALDQMFIDSTFADFFNTFRYSENLGDWLTYQPISMLNMNIPNFLKTVTSLSTPYQVKYNDGLLGKIEKLAVSAIPGLSYAFPHYYDPYTGEKQIAQKAWFLTKAIDKLTPLGLSVYNVTDMERLAIEQGIHKNQLTGRYEIGDTKIRLKAKDVERLNEFYGQLNSADLKELQSNSKTYKVKQANGTFKNLRWSQMTDKEKATIIDHIMTDNSGYAKIFILTDSGDYKYFATDSEFSALRALGITKNIYRKNNKYSGFVKAN